MADVVDAVDRTVPFRDRNVLTDEDIAQIFDQPVRTVQNWARDGRLPPPLIGGMSGCKRVYSAKHFFRWLDSNGKTRR